MTLLGPRDPLPYRPSRVLVAGTSGAGKTTYGRAAAGVLGLPHVEIDALFHGPDWTPRSSFAADVDAFSAGAAWVTEWMYSAVRAVLAERADLMLWLDLPRGRVMVQVTRRTLVRRAGRQELWNGNVEPPLRTILHDADHIIRWAWRTHAKNTARVLQLAASRPDLPIVRVRSHREGRAWLAGPLALSRR